MTTSFIEYKLYNSYTHALDCIPVQHHEYLRLSREPNPELLHLVYPMLSDEWCIRVISINNINNEDNATDHIDSGLCKTAHY